MFGLQYTSTLSVLSALTAVSFAAPRPQNWNTIDWNNIGVDWKTVNYGGQPAAATVTTQAQVQVTSAPVVVTTPTSVAAPKPTFSPSPGSGSSSGSSTTPSGGKRGLAFNYQSPALDIFDSFSKIGWGWNWDSARAGLPDKYEFVPMMWSPSHADKFDSDFKASPAKYVLSFNEPDITGQASMSVADAVKGHIDKVNKYADQGAKIGAVSVSNGQAPMGLDYLKNFLQQCGGNCKVDFCPVHWYGCDAAHPCSVEDDLKGFQTQMTAAVAACNGMPVWITEFQKLGSMDEQQSFVTKAIEWLEAPEQAKIERYSYFMVADGSLTNGKSLSNVGTTYASA